MSVLKKWGNSYAVRIPKHMVEQLNLVENEELELRTQRDSIVISPLNKEARLQRLLEGIERQEETDWGAAVGKEVW